eukprot:6023315-Amphidinium_carterae.3
MTPSTMYYWLVKLSTVCVTCFPYGCCDGLGMQPPAPEPSEAPVGTEPAPAAPEAAKGTLVQKSWRDLTALSATT